MMGYLDCLQGLVGYGCSDKPAIIAGVETVVQDAVRVLDQAVTSELATTDTTKTVAGAMLEVSLTLVGLVAMASGFCDMLEWSCRLLWWAPCTRVVAKVFTCGVVLVALVLPPVFSLVQEQKAQSNNADGSNSKVGLLAADASFLSSAPYVAVGVVSVRLKAEYDSHAFSLVIFNLVLSVVGALWVGGKIVMAGPAGGGAGVVPAVAPAPASAAPASTVAGATTAAGAGAVASSTRKAVA